MENLDDHAASEGERRVAGRKPQKMRLPYDELDVVQFI